MSFTHLFRAAQSRLIDYAHLMRWHKPIGILLLLWPTLSALWIASAGRPTPQHLFIFITGTILMRSAGCIINDWADRDFDHHVARTRDRPLAAGRISVAEALLIAIVLSILAWVLIIPLNTFTHQLALLAILIAFSYPFFKRFFAIPQAYLGIAFGFGIPMAFAATNNTVPNIAWLFLLGNIFWTIAYDTAYAMVDRDDDVKIGIKTSALTFGRFDIIAISICYTAFFAIMAYIGIHLSFSNFYWLGWSAAIGCAIYHLKLLLTRTREKYFAAFMHNNWLGACLFFGIAGAYYSR